MILTISFAQEATKEKKSQTNKMSWRHWWKSKKGLKNGIINWQRKRSRCLDRQWRSRGSLRVKDLRKSNTFSSFLRIVRRPVLCLACTRKRSPSWIIKVKSLNFLVKNLRLFPYWSQMKSSGRTWLIPRTSSKSEGMLYKSYQCSSS